MSRLYSIYLQYTDKHLPEGITHLDALEHRISPGKKATRIIIDNFLPANQTINKDDCTIFGGDNTAHEFSGWDKGVSILKKTFKLQKDDIILFSNDSFFRNYDPNLGVNFSPNHLKQAFRKSAIVGVLDEFPEQLVINGKKRKSWIRSNCFLMSCAMLYSLKTLQMPIPKNIFFDLTIEPFFSYSCDLDPQYQAYIKIWLLKEESELLSWRNHWYKSEPLTTENAEMMRQKAYSILCEHALSARVCDLGGSLINIIPKPKTNFVEKCMNRLHNLKRRH
jgi:hypothetical protein